MPSFLYLPQQSPVHRLHPSTKIIGLALLFVPPLAFNNPAFVGGTWLLALAILAAGKSLPNLNRIAGFCLAVFILATVMWSLFIEVRDEAYNLRRFTLEGTLYGLAMGCRINTFLLIGLAFISTTRVEEFALGLRALGLPNSVCLGLTLGFRLMPTYADTTATVVQAQRSRGLDFERGGLITRLRKYTPLLVPVMAYALRRADSLAMALEAKGFGGPARRTEFLQLKFRVADLVCLICLVVLGIVCIWVRHLGYGAVLPRL